MNYFFQVKDMDYGEEFDQRKYETTAPKSFVKDAIEYADALWRDDENTESIIKSFKSKGHHGVKKPNGDWFADFEEVFARNNYFIKVLQFETFFIK